MRENTGLARALLGQRDGGPIDSVFRVLVKVVDLKTELDILKLNYWAIVFCMIQGVLDGMLLHNRVVGAPHFFEGRF